MAARSPLRLAVLALFVAASAARAEQAAGQPAAPPANDSGPSAQDLARFALLKQRFLNQQGIPPAAAGVPAPGAVLPPVPAAAPGMSWQDQERERAAGFDKQFGAGAYAATVDFEKRCVSADGCNKLAASDIINGAYQYVGLQKDVEKKLLAPDSPEYQSRDDEIKAGIRPALHELRPAAGSRTAYQEELIKVSDPIVKKIFTPQELLKYAETNAAATGSAPMYNYLGQTLNDLGPASRAREAFDKALEKDPRNEAALSGRAVSRLNLQDYPGAIADARTALKLDPSDMRALSVIKFAEGRSGAGGSASAASFGGDAGPGGAGSQAAARPGYAPAGAGELDAARRSEALVAEAKRSLGMGDALAASRSLRKAVELNPSNAQALSLAAMAYSRMKDYAAALAAAEAGLKLVPRSAALLDAKAFALNHLKDYRGALAAADQALAINPYDPVAYFNRAAALGGLRDRAGMLSSLRSAAGLDARFAPALDAALRLPADSDILFLFPGETAAQAPEPPPAAPGPGRLPLAAGGAAALLALGAGALLLRRKRPVAAPPTLSSSRRAPTLVGGKFALGAPIGSGGMGVVYAGRDVTLDRAVAVKRMREELRSDPGARKRFISEAKLVARLQHPNVVSIHAIVEEDGEVYLVFEYVKGRTMHDILAREVRLPFARARDLFRGAARALDYAHGRGVIHRDFKPANVMVDDQNQVRVMDFGIARLTEEALSRVSKTGTIVGTPVYMAPEQEQGVVRGESDVYAMTVCLYEALTGRRPFEGTGAGLLMNKLKGAYAPASTRAAGLPAGLDAVLAKGLEPDPEKRCSSAGALLRDLETLG